MRNYLESERQPFSQPAYKTLDFISVQNALRLIRLELSGIPVAGKMLVDAQNAFPLQAFRKRIQNLLEVPSGDSRHVIRRMKPIHFDTDILDTVTAVLTTAHSLDTQQPRQHQLDLNQSKLPRNGIAVLAALIEKPNQFHRLRYLSERIDYSGESIANATLDIREHIAPVGIPIYVDPQPLSYMCELAAIPKNPHTEECEDSK